MGRDHPLVGAVATIYRRRGARVRRRARHHRFAGHRTRLRLPYYLTLLAQLQLEAGQTEQGLAALRTAWDTLQRNDERHWEAELHRVRAELLLAEGVAAAEVEAELREA